MRCPDCQRENPDDAAFCGGCGAGLRRICAECGRENPHESRFCNGCGRDLDAGAGTDAPRVQVAEDVVAMTGTPESGFTKFPAVPRPMPATLAEGRYTIDRLLGEGGNKRVYLARDDRLDREVAIAMIKTDVLDDAARLRLQREAQAMGRLGDHPNIVTVHDVLEEQGSIYIVSQYMAGGDLDQRIASAPDGRLPLTEAVAIAMQVCEALGHAHGRGVVHRDLKPGNIWLDGDGSAKLGDFGLALAADRSRLTSEGTTVGTVAFMPPEQALGRTPDARSDLYALGATLYEMVTGRPPFAGDDAVAVISQHLHTRPVAASWHNAEVPKPLDALILDLLAKDPESRPASAAVVAGRLQALDSVSSLQSSGKAAVNPLDRLSSGVFVGRESEMAVMRSALDESLSGEPRVLLVAGEPGIGKTRASEELTTYARMRGARVLWGHCYEGEGAPPFWPWVQIVRAHVEGHEPHELMADFGFGAGDVAEIVPELREVLPGLQPSPPAAAEQARFRLFDAVTSALRRASERTPLVLVLDDLHWSDQPSLLLLQFLARELGKARLLVVGTYRDVELRRRHPLSETLAELSRSAASTRVLLRGLGAADVASFIQQSANVRPPSGLVEAVYRETEGNPFFVHEVVRLLTSEGRLDDRGEVESWSLELPQGVRDVVGRRLNRLSENCNDVLTVAAVLGREFESRILERVAQVTEAEVVDGLEEALGARLVTEGERSGVFRFSHALVRETLYEELSNPRRVALHRRAGDVMEELVGAALGPQTAAIAHHLFQSVQAGDPERALAACAGAAEWARQRHAWEEAALHCERAVQVAESLPEVDSHRLAELLAAQAEMQGLGTAVEQGRRAALRAADLARSLGDGELLARAALAYGVGVPFIQAGSVDATMTGLLEQALDMVSEEPTAQRALLLQRLGQELAFSGEDGRRAELMAQARAIAAELGDRALEADLRARSVFSIEGYFELDRDVVLEHAREARSAGDLEAEGVAWSTAAAAGWWHADLALVERAVAGLTEVGEKLRTPNARALAAVAASSLPLVRGSFEETVAGVRDLARTLAVGAVRDSARQWVGSQMYVVGWLRGTELPIEPAQALVDRAPERSVYRGFLVACLALAGHRNEASKELGLLGADGFRRLDRDGTRLAVLCLCATACQVLRAAAHTDALREQLLPHAGHFVTVPPAGVAPLGPVDLHLGNLAAVAGATDAARAHYQAALEIARNLGAVPFVILAKLGMATVAASQQDPGPSAASLDEIVREARGLGMEGVVRDGLALKLALRQGSAEGETLPLDG